MARFGSKTHLRELRTRARQELGTGSEPPTVEQLVRAVEAIDEAIHAQTLSSYGRVLISDGWGYALAPDEFLRRLGPRCLCGQRWPCPAADRGEERHWLRSPKPPSVRLVREHNDLDHEFTSGAGARSAEEWSE